MWSGDIAGDKVGRFDRWFGALGGLAGLSPRRLPYVAHVQTGILAPEDFEDPDAFVAVVSLGSDPGYRDVRDFIGTVTDDALADRLSVAIQGKGAFRRFKDALAPNEPWWGAWLTFSNERQMGRARWWLADEGFRPATSADA